MLHRASKNHFLSVILSLLACSLAFAQAEKVLTVDSGTDDLIYYPIKEFLAVLPDPNGTLKIEDIKGAKYSGQFRKDSKWLTSPIKTHWIRLKVKSNLPVDKQLLSYIQGSIVDLYEENDAHQFTVRRSGLLVPVPGRDQKNRFGHMPYNSILVKHNSTQTFYWRVNTDNFPILSPHTNLESSLSSYEYVLENSRKAMFFFVCVCSILLGLGLYHLVIFIITRDKVYLYFTLYAVSACFYVMYFKGYLLELIFPRNPALHYSLAFAFTCIAFHVALLSYVRQYVDLKKNFPSWDKALILFFSVFVLTVGITSFADSRTLSTILNFIMMTPIILLEILGFVMLKAKHPLAKNYLAAFSLLFAGFIANGIFTITGVEQGIWDFGDIGLLGLEVLLAAGLAMRINILNKEKQFAQVELIKQLKENQMIQVRATNQLEDKVASRTAEIEKQNEKLTRLNLLKDKLFSIISHDIKGPLNQLSSTLYMMERDMITKEEIRQLVPQIRTNLSANTNFINELLTWAKSQLEGAKLNPQSANLQDLIDSNFQLLKPIADAKGIKLTSHLSNPLSIYADVEMIKSVVRNLSANAIKFTNPKGIIQISVGVDKSFASISVQDNGKGISTENQKKLFGSQIFTTPGTANEKGTGIGLLLCKDFVEKNGGKIWVESEEGKGSKFAFTVPLNKN